MENRKNKLLARVCSLIGVLLLMCCMILPASAASGSGNAWYSVLPLDGVRLIRSSSSVVDLPWSTDLFLPGTNDLTAGDGSAGYGVTNLHLSEDDRVAAYDVSFSDELSSFSSIVLYAHECFIYTDDLKNADFNVWCGYGGEDGCRVDISFVAHRLKSDGTVYRDYVTSISEGFHMSPGANILGYISSMLSDGNFVPSGVVYLTGLEIKFSQFEHDDQWMQFETSVRRVRAFAGAFVDQYLLPIGTEVIYQPVTGGFSFDWLVSSVDSMLTIELFPNFTIGGLLRTVVVVSLLLWFLKLMT